MGKLTDIKETDFGIDDVVSYRIGREKGSAGETFEVQIPGWVNDYIPGDYITIRGISGLTTQREYMATEGGYRTVLRGVSKIVDVVRMTPKKTLMYMSMTQDEHDDFEIANTDDDGNLRYEKLDYIPLIKICDEKTLSGGWDSVSVVKSLISKMGLEASINVRAYWVKQIQADVQSSFFDTIASIVGFLNPVMYIEDGVFYILNNPSRNGSVDLRNITQFSERQTFNYDSKVDQIRVVGGLGEWNRAKEKGIVEAEESIELYSKSEKYSASIMQVTLSGNVITTTREQGKGSYDIPKETVSKPEPGKYVYGVEMKQPKLDRVERYETVLLDPYGNRKALLSSREIGTWTSPGDPQQEYKAYESVTEYTYDFLDEIYDRPRETEKIQTISEWSWEIALFPGYPYRKFKEKTTVVSHKKVWAPNGTLLMELETVEKDVLVLQTLACTRI